MTEKRALSEDTHRLLTQGLVVLGAALVFVLFAWIVVPGLRRERAEPKAVPDAQAPTPASEGWLDDADAPARPGVEIPAVDPVAVMSPTPEMIALGRTLFAKNCVACHGPSGQGDGPAAVALNPKPRDFTRKDGWKNGSRIADIYGTLSKGLPPSAMAAYDTLSPRDRMALVHYVRSLGAFDHGADDKATLAEMGARFAQKGGRTPNRIPVTLAIAKLVREAVPVAPLAAPPPGDAAPGAALFRRAVADPARAARFLSGVAGWQTNAAALARACAAGAPFNGFAPSVATFTPDEWAALQAELARRAAP